MPDDEILDQEVTEQPDADAMTGFDLGVKDGDALPDQDGEKPPEEKKDTDKPEEDKPPVKDDKPPEKEEKPPEKKPDEKLDKDGKPEKEVEPKKDEDLTAKDRIDQRVKELEPPEDEPPEKEEEPEKPETPAKEKEPPPPKKELSSKLGRLTKEQIADHLRTIPDDILPEETIIIGDTEINLKEFADEFPEQFAAVKVLSGVIAQQVIDKALAGQKPDEAIQKRLDDQDALLHSFFWWDAVTEKHADAKQVKADKKFQTWFDDQPDNIKRFGAEEASPGDAILLLDFYKEDIAKKGVKKHDDTARDKKKRTDDLHKGTMRTKTDTSATDGEVDMDDDEAGFEEGAKE